MWTSKDQVAAVADSVDVEAWLEEFEAGFARIAGRFGRVERRMLTRALDAGTPAGWATADEFYGGDRWLRRDLQARGIGHVLAVARSHRIVRHALDGPQRVDHVAAGLPRRAWNRYSAGNGAKGHREYDWAWVTITPPEEETCGYHWLLIRRRLTDGELAFYRCWSPRPVGLPALVRVAGTRWAIEECFQTAKGQVGLDQHQVRRWTSWYRYTTLVMFAHAILAVIAVHEHRQPRRGQQLIRLTLNEIRHLLTKLVTNTTHSVSYWLAWSRWRRQHQARSRTSHYRRRGHIEHPALST